MNRWILGTAAAFALALPCAAPAQAMSHADEERLFVALDIDSSLYFENAGGSAGAEEVVGALLNPDPYSSPPQRSTYPSSGESKGKTWWRKNGWWVLTLAIGVPLFFIGTYSTTITGAVGAGY